MQTIPPPPVLVQTRPGHDVWNYENTWKQGLFDCCADKRICILTCFLRPYISYKVYRRVGENCVSCCWPMTLWSLRTKIRTLFRIHGSICGDCGTVHCCTFCALVQMHRELDLQGL